MPELKGFIARPKERESHCPHHCERWCQKLVGPGSEKLPDKNGKPHHPNCPVVRGTMDNLPTNISAYYSDADAESLREQGQYL